MCFIYFDFVEDMPDSQDESIKTICLERHFNLFAYIFKPQLYFTYTTNAKYVRWCWNNSNPYKIGQYLSDYDLYGQKHAFLIWCFFLCLLQKISCVSPDNTALRFSRFPDLILITAQGHSSKWAGKEEPISHPRDTTMLSGNTKYFPLENWWKFVGRL